MAQQAKQPRWRRRKDDRPAEIVEAALEEFAVRGFAATRLEDVATRAGVSKGTLYLYFKNKEDLFKAVVQQAIVSSLAVAEVRLRDTQLSTPALLAGIVATFARGIIETRAGAIPKLIIAEAGNFPDLARFYADEVAARGLRMFAAIIERGIARGEFRPVDSRLAAPAIVGPLLLLALWKSVLEPHATFSIEPDRYLESYLDIMLNGLSTPASSGG